MSDKYKLVIFDFDGVVVDSEYVYQKIFIKNFKKYGIDITGDDLLMNFCGNAKSSYNDILKDNLGIDKKVPDDFQKNCIDEAFDYMNETEVVNGIDDLLQYLNDNKISYVIASGGTWNWIDNILDNTNLKEYFPDNMIFTREMVKNGKPDPEVFNLAAKKLGFNNTDCIVLEDSENGVKAGISAGMKTIAFLGGKHCSDSYRSYIDNNYDVDVMGDILEVKKYF